MSGARTRSSAIHLGAISRPATDLKQTTLCRRSGVTQSKASPGALCQTLCQREAARPNVDRAASLVRAEKCQTRTGSRTSVIVFVSKICSVSGVRRAWTKPKATSTAISAASTKEQMAPMRAISAKTEKP